MRLGRISCIVATCCLTLGMLIASTQSVEAAGGAEPIRESGAAAQPAGPIWQSFTTANSPLPDDVISTIAVDRNDVGWIGTLHGTARFDGTTWMTFTAANGFPFPGARKDETAVLGIAVDSTNTIWVATPHAIVSYDGSGWTKQLTVDLSMAGADLIAAAPNGDIWVSGYQYLLCRHDGVWAQHADPYRPQRLGNLAVDHSGAVWVADMDATSIDRFDGTAWSSFDRGRLPLSMSKYRSLNVDREGNVWYVDVNGVAMFDGGWSRGFPSMPGDHPEFPGSCPSWLEVDGRGVFWVGSGTDGARPGKGLIRYDGTRSWYYTVENSGLPANDVNIVRAGNDRRIWIGTYGSGIAILDGSASPEDLFDGASRSGVRREYPATQSNASLDVRPNVVHGSASAHFTLPAPGRVRASIIDALGTERSAQFDGTLGAGEHVLPLDLADLPDGWYFLRVQTGSASMAVPVRVLQ